MRQLVRWFAVALLLALMMGLGRTGLLASLDNALQDWRFQAASTAVSGDTVFVEIDSRSLAEAGTWPWPRSLYGQVLDRLMDAGADEVAFDIDFSSTSTEAEDAAFEAALERAGGFAVLAAFVQDDGAGGVTLSHPLERFSRHADPVLVNVLLDGHTGRALWVPTMIDAAEGKVEAMATRLGQPTRALPDLVPIDFSLDLSGIPRYSFTDVLHGRVDPSLLAGKQVIVGASAIELRDFFQVPRYGIIPGPLVQALAVETVRSGRTIASLGTVPGIAVVALLGLLVLTLGRPRLWVAAVALLIVSVGGELLAAYAYANAGWLVGTAAMHVGLIALFALIVADDGYAQLLGRRAASRRLKFLATHEARTGLLSRHGFVSTGPAGKSEEIVVLQLQHMDELRATLGYDVADAVLVQFANRLVQLGPMQAAMVGEQTFAVARDDRGDASGLRNWADTLTANLAGHYQLTDHLLHIGLAAGYSAGPLSRATLLQQAETALLHARAEHRTTRAYMASDQEALDRRRQLERDLREALRREELHVAYQPQVDLGTRLMTGAEALIRWQHPVLGAISPAEFIPLAEETGLIADLGLWVLGRACMDAAGWPLPLKVSVNVSPLQFERVNVEAQVHDALAASGLPAERLELEITEAARVTDPRLVSRVLTQLSGLGIGLAVDDFGTGYSSLSYFQQLPFDTLKIDQQFVRFRSQTRQSEALLVAIVEMARRLDKHIVAEGIEDEATAALLHRLGCHIGQGYYFSRPVPLPQLVALMEEDRRSQIV